MSRKSRREIESDLDELAGDGEGPVAVDVEVCHCEDKETCEHGDMEPIADFTGGDT